MSSREEAEVDIVVVTEMETPSEEKDESVKCTHGPLDGGTYVRSAYYQIEWSDSFQERYA
jgi:hypothetical protein